MKSIRNSILEKGTDILNVYFTAGHPTLDSTGLIIKSLSECGVDLIELGMPYSDPLADGTTIQQSSAKALQNGQTISNILAQVKSARQNCETPIIMMGYFNQILQYGVDQFLRDAHNAGIQGLIIPDLPMNIFEEQYKDLFENYNMEVSFLITPMTSLERVYQADRLSSAFIYVVSQSSITGKQGGISDEQLAYFNRIQSLKLQSPTLIGFGIHDKKTRDIANLYSNGVIIGSAFIRALEKNENSYEATKAFISQLS